MSHPDTWFDFYDSGHLNRYSPYQYKRIWVWRPEWTNGPQALNARDLNPMMNVIGLKWRPYDGPDGYESDDRYQMRAP